VSVVSRLGNEGPIYRDSIPGGGSVLSIRSLTHRQYCTSDGWALVPLGIKRPVREGDCFSTDVSSAEVKNARRCTSTL